ncbi:MAG: NlpBDapX lipoprotein [Gallionellales bacterium RIFCSPLOWO2_02_FULL_59_110]|nr:MAG: NlpBDapX lipoprotein [Gallionellales bacterium RIFCSPLOWO2_02_FULL_59_110]OGT04391.1 MAG: NlpBDapX lipoprotein [Gallionellales bacterium RIFCSPLOWO2_02_58_13]
MKVLHIGISGITLVALIGCSSVGLGTKRVDYRTGAVQVPSLEVPPDLTAPTGDDRYRVPQGEGESVATFSDYSKSSTAAAQGRGVNAVLPEVKDVRLERDGARRWLVVKDKAENVWAVVKAFCQENGLPIKSENQAAGIMETEWVENRAKIPEDGLRKLLGKVIDSLYSSGERDQYRIRLERAPDGISTEVYITHRGMEEVLDGSKTNFRWQPRPNDPEMEAIMLQRLMLRFGGVEAGSGGAAREASGTATVDASGPVGTASLEETPDGKKLIVVNDAFDRSWRRVGLAIERAGLAVDDRDRAKGTYFLRQAKAEKGWLDKLQFWKDGENTHALYRVNIKDGGAACRVTVTDEKGASDETSRKIIEAIYKNIDQ